MMKLILGVGSILITGVYCATLCLNKDSADSLADPSGQPAFCVDALVSRHGVPINSPIPDKRRELNNVPQFPSFAPSIKTPPQTTSNFSSFQNAAVSTVASAAAFHAEERQPAGPEKSDGINPFASHFSPLQSPGGLPKSMKGTTNSSDDGVSEHEWAFVTEFGGLLFGDLSEPVELELKHEYGTAKIPMSDVIAISRAKIETPGEGEKQVVAEVSDFVAIAKTIDDSKKEAADATDAADKPDLEKSEIKVAAAPEKPADDLIVIATRSGSFLVGQCDLPDFKLRTKWGTMTIENAHVDMLCSKSGGWRQLANGSSFSSADGWVLVPFSIIVVERQFESRSLNLQLAPTSKVRIRSSRNR